MDGREGLRGALDPPERPRRRRPAHRADGRGHPEDPERRGRDRARLRAGPARGGHRHRRGRPPRPPRGRHRGGHPRRGPRRRRVLPVPAHPGPPDARSRAERRSAAAHAPQGRRRNRGHLRRRPGRPGRRARHPLVRGDRVGRRRQGHPIRAGSRVSAPRPASHQTRRSAGSPWPSRTSTSPTDPTTRPAPSSWSTSGPRRSTRATPRIARPCSTRAPSLQRVGDLRLMVAAALSNHRGFNSKFGTQDEERIAVLQAALDAVGNDPSTDRALLLATLTSELEYAAPVRGARGPHRRGDRDRRDPSTIRRRSRPSSTTSA